VILVTSTGGHLLGLVTVKDVLRHEAAVEHSHSLATDDPVYDPDGERERGLEGVLEEAWIWGVGLFGGRQAQGTPIGEEREAFGYELDERNAGHERENR
jgi:hypothetical protein